jgi:hypothetical protein
MLLGHVTSGLEENIGVDSCVMKEVFYVLLIVLVMSKDANGKQPRRKPNAKKPSL